MPNKIFFTRRMRTQRGTTLLAHSWGDPAYMRQGLTRPHASRSGEPWTDADTAIALDRRKSTVQAALELGRTAYAVRTRRRDAARGAEVGS